jgi:hypothetical protein
MFPMAKDSQKDPQTRGRGQGDEGKYQPACGKTSPWEENTVRLAAPEDYKED